ncbi:unnamed protein product, partial [Vitis vinifera]|uniref:Secreted protein n=1 Tax=Vitis vinifera TaxID=29760 RepID=D7UBR8_VITVI
MRFISSHLFFTLTWVTCSAESAQCAFIKNSSSLIMRASSSLHILPLLLPMKGIIRRSMGAINHHHCIEENCTLKTHHFNLLLLFQGLRHPTINSQLRVFGHPIIRASISLPLKFSARRQALVFKSSPTMTRSPIRIKLHHYFFNLFRLFRSSYLVSSTADHIKDTLTFHPFGPVRDARAHQGRTELMQVFRNKIRWQPLSFFT